MVVSHSLVNKNTHWLPKAMAVCLGAGAAASVVFFGVQLSTPLVPLLLAAPVSPISSTQDVSSSVARALGVVAPSTLQVSLTDSQFKLLGVISSASGQGSALIATDGQWPKAYRVGQSVKEDLKLVSLSATKAVIKSPSMQLQLELPVVEKP